MPQSTPASEPEYAAFIGIDWADRQHAWSLETGLSARESGKFQQTPEDIEAWASGLASRFPGRRVAVALEQRRGALVYSLMKYPHLVIYPIHASTSHLYRQAIFPSGSKDDPRDAGALLDLLTLHRSHLKPLEADTTEIRQLQNLVEKRRMLVDMRTAESNRVKSELKLYFPQALEWFDDVCAPIFSAFIERWPTLGDLQKESPETLRAFFHQHGSRSESRIEGRLKRIREAMVALDDAAIVKPGVCLIRTLLRIIAELNAGIRTLDEEIDQIYNAHPDAIIFRSFPGAGRVMAPRLLAAFGSWRDRFANASEMQSYSGIAPVTRASGRHKCVQFRWACPKFLRQTFHEYAALSRHHCEWAWAFYEKHKRTKGHHGAVRALAFKWIRILFRCWQSRQPYQEQIHTAPRDISANPAPRSSSGSPHSGTGIPSTCGKIQKSSLKTTGEILKMIMTEA
jgi:transposase